jgi:hypothetical protein
MAEQDQPSHASRAEQDQPSLFTFQSGVILKIYLKMMNVFV